MTFTTPASSMDKQRRPTLPSLHTLDLPTLKPQAPGLPYALYDNGRQISRPLHVPNAPTHRPRQFSTSSSRTPSPTPSDKDAAARAGPFQTHSFLHQHPEQKRPNLRLVPCASIDEADAVVFVPPRTLTGTNQPSQALLLVGESLNELRHPQRKVAKGARIHPYKFARPSASRRASTSSTCTSLSSLSIS